MSNDKIRAIQSTPSMLHSLWTDMLHLSRTCRDVALIDDEVGSSFRDGKPMSLFPDTQAPRTWCDFIHLYEEKVEEDPSEFFYHYPPSRDFSHFLSPEHSRIIGSSNMPTSPDLLVNDDIWNTSSGELHTRMSALRTTSPSLCDSINSIKNILPPIASDGTYQMELITQSASLERFLASFRLNTYRTSDTSHHEPLPRLHDHMKTWSAAAMASQLDHSSNTLGQEKNTVSGPPSTIVQGTHFQFLQHALRLALYGNISQSFFDMLNFERNVCSRRPTKPFHKTEQPIFRKIAHYQQKLDRKQQKREKLSVAAQKEKLMLNAIVETKASIDTYDFLVDLDKLSEEDLLKHLTKLKQFSTSIDNLEKNSKTMDTNELFISDEDDEGDLRDVTHPRPIFENVFVNKKSRKNNHFINR